MSEPAGLGTTPWGALPPPSTRRVAWGSAPADPPSRDTADSGTAVADLGGLFGAPTPATTPQAGEDPSAALGSDLADVFGPVPATPAAPAAAAGEDLADLFGSEEPEAAQPPSDLSGIFGSFGALQPPEAAKAPSAAPAVLPDPVDPPVIVVAPAAPAPAPAAQQPAGDPSSSAASTQSSLADRMAAGRAAADAARISHQDSPVLHQQTAALISDPRYTRARELQPKVDRLLGLGQGGEPEIVSFMHNVELTRDKARDVWQRRRYEELLTPKVISNGLKMDTAEEKRLVFDIAYDALLGIGPLGPLWRDNSISEIMVSGPDKVTIERNGQLEITPVKFLSMEDLDETVRRIAAASKDDRQISSTNPLVTIQLPGARVQFVWRPLAVSRVAIAIRKFGALMGMQQLLDFGSLTPQMAEFLSAAVRARSTVLVSGGTSSGKTTVINALSEFIPATERVITIEDSLELQLRNLHVEAFVTKEAASADDHVRFGQDELLKASLRMRPDRIIVGEIRDGKGCSVMLEAANTGHDGTMTTIHANSPTLALARMANLLRKADNMPDDVARTEVATAIDLVVQVVKVRGRRFISHISTVDTDSCSTRDVFVGTFPPDADGPQFRLAEPLRPDTATALKMTDAGIDPGAWR